MEKMNLKEAAVFIREDLRLKTFPVAVKFLQDEATFPEKARRPSVAMGKRIALCQGVTMARNYGWTVGLAKEDIICVPAAIAFGFSDATDPSLSLAGLFREVGFSGNDDLARKEGAFKQTTLKSHRNIHKSATEKVSSQFSVSHF